MISPKKKPPVNTKSIKPKLSFNFSWTAYAYYAFLLNELTGKRCIVNFLKIGFSRITT